MIRLYIIVGAVLASLLSGFAAGWRVHAWKAAADDRDRAVLAASDLREQAVAQRRAGENLAKLRRSIAGAGLKFKGETNADLARPVLDCPKVVGDAVVPGSLGRLLNDIDRAATATPR